MWGFSLNCDWPVNTLMWTLVNSQGQLKCHVFFYSPMTHWCSGPQWVILVHIVWLCAENEENRPECFPSFLGHINFLAKCPKHFQYKNNRMDHHRTWWKDAEWAREEPITYLYRSRCLFLTFFNVVFFNIFTVFPGNNSWILMKKTRHI